MPTPDWHVTDSYDPEELAVRLEKVSMTQRNQYGSADVIADDLLHAALMIRHLMEELEEKGPTQRKVELLLSNYDHQAGCPSYPDPANMNTCECWQREVWLLAHPPTEGVHG